MKTLAFNGNSHKSKCLKIIPKIEISSEYEIITSDKV